MSALILTYKLSEEIVQINKKRKETVLGLSEVNLVFGIFIMSALDKFHGNYEVIKKLNSE